MERLSYRTATSKKEYHLTQYANLSKDLKKRVGSLKNTMEDSTAIQTYSASPLDMIDSLKRPSLWLYINSMYEVHSQIVKKWLKRGLTMHIYTVRLKNSSLTMYVIHNDYVRSAVEQ